MTHLHNDIEEVVASGLYDLVIYGHTHSQDIRRVGKTMVINPGEATDWITNSANMVILDLDDMSYEVVSI